MELSEYNTAISFSNQDSNANGKGALFFGNNKTFLVRVFKSDHELEKFIKENPFVFIGVETEETNFGCLIIQSKSNGKKSLDRHFYNINFTDYSPSAIEEISELHVYLSVYGEDGQAPIKKCMVMNLSSVMSGAITNHLKRQRAQDKKTSLYEYFEISKSIKDIPDGALDLGICSVIEKCALIERN